ncbi:MAG: asparagine synthase (glutamine-hydrolyzing) [Candidatus Aminicenantes bacterium]|nr:asparagine synthase (glutamine-hydrolyzing) [Candidatus Aminicenantes bacterium]NIM80066.1 asparagine synthase (glutamine-hydrolyzing) [Candidatus Aminicenantes bacterium]NIN19409.1 asparagine synthase (glutamine-hydrolyzing) [Candidatus Aminicenantes bacterium]NIN43308.1 asparagine synthase (glutamine-hydrolyzing) [Candidatus Aminicenantes bacterium]NIN86052.1 asparagine synthase (glutamine-hydrolyzing) [Candidatus Aminicenantes bacterium]
MCGICGFYQYENEADEQTLAVMNNQIIHRGPDDEGYYFENQVGLAARRLSIIDLKTGHQPLPSHSKTNWITYNGEVYNFPELRAELEAKGYKFRTKTDTEVIVNLYEEYGTGFVKQLRGMFAIGIYDKKNHRLVLARDHIGIKPLYYCLKPGNKNLVFASEIKSILKYPGISREIDPEAVDLFLTLEYIPAPFSIFKQIRKLPAGHILTYENQKLRIEKYWDVYKAVGQGSSEKRKPDFNELKERFYALLRESVKMRMIADVPLGAFLSGGIDSSSIVYAMAGLSQQKIKTFSIGFEEKSYSELKYSNIISEKFNTDHYTKNLQPNINELVLYLADFWDEPLGDFSNFPTYLVSKTARERVTVVLSGDGGDEIFGGYEHYIAQKFARFIDFPLFRPVHKLMAKITHLFPPSELKKGFVNRIKRFSEGLQNSHINRHFRWMIFLSNLQKRTLYSPDFLSSDYLKPLNARIPFDGFFEHSRQFEGINRDLYLDFKTYMVDNILVKVDRMSMATSLEARVPLLDYKMVEFAFSLPSHYKLGGSTTKWFFKKAMEGILPDEIIYRQKEGFSIPIKNWLKSELKELMMEYLSEKRVKEAGFFNHAYIQKMVNEHLNNKQNHAHRLWALILFHLWRERFGFAN